MPASGNACIYGVSLAPSVKEKWPHKVIRNRAGQWDGFFKNKGGSPSWECDDSKLAEFLNKCMYYWYSICLWGCLLRTSSILNWPFILSNAFIMQINIEISFILLGVVKMFKPVTCPWIKEFAIEYIHSPFKYNHVW